MPLTFKSRKLETCWISVKCPTPEMKHFNLMEVQCEISTGHFYFADFFLEKQLLEPAIVEGSCQIIFEPKQVKIIDEIQSHTEYKANLNTFLMIFPCDITICIGNYFG